MPADLTVNLPWQGLAAGGAAMAGAFSGNPQQSMAALGPAYNQNYQAALGINAGLYSGVQTGYQQLRGQLDQQYQGISQGYQQLYGDVLGRIAGSNQSNIQDINAQYNQYAGNALSSAASRGLGNSSVQDNLQRAIALDRSRAITASQNQFAQLGAGYASQLGQAGLGAQQQGAQLGANLGLQQLNFAGSAQAPYPNAGLYGQLAQQAGALNEAQQNRALQMQALQMQLGHKGFSSPAGGGGVAGSAGYGALRPSGMFDYGGSYGLGPSADVSSYYGGGVASGPSPQQTAAAQGFSSGNYEAPFATAGSDAMAMGAVGGGAIAGLGFGGYGLGVGGQTVMGGYGGYPQAEQNFTDEEY